MQEIIRRELEDAEDAAEVLKRPRGRPPKSETEALQAENRQLEAEKERLKAAMEAGRERLDPRVEATKTREGGRIPFGARRKRLSVQAYSDQLEGKHPAWIDGRYIVEALQGGYQPVFKEGIRVGDGEDRNTDLGSWVSQRVGTDASGAPLLNYLMGLRLDLHEEDIRHQRAKRAETINTVKHGGGGIDPRYQHGVTITR
jgi:hypothetical protein